MGHNLKDGTTGLLGAASWDNVPMGHNLDHMLFSKFKEGTHCHNKVDDNENQCRFPKIC